jgi:hypothetical protein
VASRLDLAERRDHFGDVVEAERGRCEICAGIAAAGLTAQDSPTSSRATMTMAKARKARRGGDGSLPAGRATLRAGSVPGMSSPPGPSLRKSAGIYKTNEMLFYP